MPQLSNLNYFVIPDSDRVSTRTLQILDSHLRGNDDQGVKHDI